MILDRALAAARQASANNRNQDPCDTCQLGNPGHTHRPNWHGLPCPTCDCGGAFADVPEAWLTPKITDDDQQEAS